MSGDELRCLIPGCTRRRWETTATCTWHWQRLTGSERRQLGMVLYGLACCAIVGEQVPFNAALRAVDLLLERWARELDFRSVVAR